MKITAKRAGSTGRDEQLAEKLKEFKYKVESLQITKDTDDAK